MIKVLEDRIENGWKITFPLRFSYVHLKLFFDNFNRNWFLPQTHKTFPLCFFISFLNYWWFSITHQTHKFSRRLWKFSKMQVFIDLSSKFFKKFARMGGLLPLNLYKCIFLKLCKLLRKFSRNNRKIFKNCE